MKPKPPLALYHNDAGKLIAGVGPKVGLRFIESYFPSARTIRIARAYFSLSGYQIGRERADPEVQFHVLVGREEGSNVQRAVIEEIRQELQNCETDWYRAVSDLVER